MLLFPIMEVAYTAHRIYRHRQPRPLLQKTPHLLQYRTPPICRLPPRLAIELRQEVGVFEVLERLKVSAVNDFVGDEEEAEAKWLEIIVSTTSNIQGTNLETYPHVVAQQVGDQVRRRLQSTLGYYAPACMREVDGGLVAEDDDHDV